MRTTRRQPPLVNLFRVLLREVADTADALSRSAGYECSGREMMPGAEARAYAVTLHGATVSASLFPLLGTAPDLGRFFTEEARPDAERVAVLTTVRGCSASAPTRASSTPSSAPARR